MSAEEAEPAEETTRSSSRSVGKSALSAAAALAGGLFGMDEQLPKFEDAARELVHPLFEKLKKEVGLKHMWCVSVCVSACAHRQSCGGVLRTARCLKSWVVVARWAGQ